jgi:hypothetical protein
MASMLEHKPVLLEKSGRYFFHIEELGLIGSGTDIASAYEDLKIRYADLLEQARAADLLDEIPRKRGAGTGDAVVVRSDLKGFLIKTAIVFGAILLVLLPLVLSVGNAVERAANKFQPKGGPHFLVQLEENLHKMAAPQNDLPIEQQQRIVSDLRALVARVKPFTDELRPLAESPAPACPPTASAPTSSR